MHSTVPLVPGTGGTGYVTGTIQHPSKHHHLLMNDVCACFFLHEEEGGGVKKGGRGGVRNKQ